MFLQPSIITSSVSSSKCDSSERNTNLPTPNLKLSTVTKNLEICHYCRIIISSCPEKLFRCPDCSATYCGNEHRDLDWTSHKIICHKWRKTNEPSYPASVPNNNALNSAFSTPSTSFENKPHQERMIETNDPDIQIIENGKNKTEVPINRKRTYDKNGRVFKDHSKNLLYKVTFQDHVKALIDRGISVNQHQATALRLKYIAEHVIRSLNEYGWAVVDNFLGEKYCSRAYSEVGKLYEKGMFSAGKLMDRGKFDSNPEEIRSDKIFWFGTDNGDETVRNSLTIRLLISMIDSVVVNFKGRIPPFDIAGRSKAMIAIYPGNGTRYVKHVDNPVKDGRCITTIYYCNPGWKLAEHGGTLRLYPETSEVPMDVDPQADRLIFFWSDRRVPHEVLPVFRHRYAITIWYFDYEERRKAIEQNNEHVLEPSSATSIVTPTPSGFTFNKDGAINSTNKPLRQNTFEFLQNNYDLMAVRKELQQKNIINSSLKHFNHQDRQNSGITNSESARSNSISNLPFDDRCFRAPTLPAVRSNSMNRIAHVSPVVLNSKNKVENYLNQPNKTTVAHQINRINGEMNNILQKNDIRYLSENDEEDINVRIAQMQGKHNQSDYFEI